MKVQSRRPVMAANIYYSPPGDKELLIYDFYAAELLDFSIKKGPVQGFSVDEGDSDLASAREAIPTVLNSIVPLILNAIFQAVAGEMRHLQGLDNVDVDSPIRKPLARYFREFGARNTGKSDLAGYKFIKDRMTQYTSEGQIVEPANEVERNIGIISAIKSGSRTTFMLAAQEAFAKGNWRSGYGGKKWADICNGWLELNRATSIEDKFSWVDHCLDLEHNNDTVFNKIPGFAKNGKYVWIKKALDFKYTAPPIELLGKCSSQMRKICLRVFKSYNPALLNDPTKKSIEQTVDPKIGNSGLKIGDTVQVIGQIGIYAGKQGKIIQVIKAGNHELIYIQPPGGGVILGPFSSENLTKIIQKAGFKVGDIVKINSPGALNHNYTAKILRIDKGIYEVATPNPTWWDADELLLVQSLPNGESINKELAALGVTVNSSNSQTFAVTGDLLVIQKLFMEKGGQTMSVNNSILFTIPTYPEVWIYKFDDNEPPEDHRSRGAPHTSDKTELIPARKENGTLPEPEMISVDDQINKGLESVNVKVNKSSLPGYFYLVGPLPTIQGYFSVKNAEENRGSNGIVFTVPDSLSLWKYRFADNKQASTQKQIKEQILFKRGDQVKVVAPGTKFFRTPGDIGEVIGYTFPNAYVKVILPSNDGYQLFKPEELELVRK